MPRLQPSVTPEALACLVHTTGTQRLSAPSSRFFISDSQIDGALAGAGQALGIGHRERLLAAFAYFIAERHDVAVSWSLRRTARGPMHLIDLGWQGAPQKFWLDGELRGSAPRLSLPMERAADSWLKAQMGDIQSAAQAALVSPFGGANRLSIGWWALYRHVPEELGLLQPHLISRLARAIAGAGFVVVQHEQHSDDAYTDLWMLPRARRGAVFVG